MRVDSIVAINPQMPRPYQSSQKQKQSKKEPEQKKRSFQEILNKELKSTFNQYV